jgi:hypothetical protein
LGNAVRQNNLSEKSYQIFISDVVGMLRGWSEDERRRERLRITLNPPAEKPDAYKKGQQAAESMFASLNSLMDSRFKSISDNYLFVLRTALEKCIERTDAPPGQTCFRLSV